MGTGMGTGMGKTMGLSHASHPLVPELGWDWLWEQHPGMGRGRGQGGKHCAGPPPIPFPILSWRCPGPAEEQSCILEPSQQPHPCALGPPAVAPQCWIQVLGPSEALLGCTDTSFQPFSQHRSLSQPMLQPTRPRPPTSPSPQPLSVPAAMKSVCPAEQPDTQPCHGTTCSERGHGLLHVSQPKVQCCISGQLGV